MGGLLHLVQRGGAWAGCALIAAPNATAHPSTANVLITVLLYDGPLLCGFNVAIEWLSCCVEEALSLRLRLSCFRLRPRLVFTEFTINNMLNDDTPSFSHTPK